MDRYQRLTDLFIIKCRRCQSEDVDLYSEECPHCGNIINAECNNCGQQYNFHDFNTIEIEYDINGKEIKGDE